MSETVYKCYFRDCGDEGKFIVLEAGRERNGNGFVYCEGISIYGHYNENGTYDDAYVSQIIQDSSNYGNKIMYYSYRLNKKALLMQFIENCTFEISAPLEETVEEHSILAKTDVYERFLKRHNKEIHTDEELKVYGLSFDLWNEVCLSDGLVSEYSEFFNDACSVLESKGFDVSGLKNQCK